MSPEERAFWSMRSRCLDPKAKGYAYWGGRGITICDRWQSLKAFLADMGPRPGPGYSLDRIDVNGNYEPGNCRWATDREQARNRRTNIMVDFEGEQLCLAEACERAGVPYTAAYARLRKGQPFTGVPRGQGSETPPKVEAQVGSRWFVGGVGRPAKVVSVQPRWIVLQRFRTDEFRVSKQIFRRRIQPYPVHSRSPSQTNAAVAGRAK